MAPLFFCTHNECVLKSQHKDYIKSKTSIGKAIANVNSFYTSLARNRSFTLLLKVRNV